MSIFSNYLPPTNPGGACGADFEMPVFVFFDCPDEMNILQSEICEILMVPPDPENPSNPKTVPATDTAEGWSAVIDNTDPDMIHRFICIGDMAEPESTPVTVPKFGEKIAYKTYTLNADMVDMGTNDGNYEGNRTLSNGSKVFIWAVTVSGRVLGKFNKGILCQVFNAHTFERGEASNITAKYRFVWKNAFDPPMSKYPLSVL